MIEIINKRCKQADALDHTTLPVFEVALTIHFQLISHSL